MPDRAGLVNSATPRTTPAFERTEPLRWFGSVARDTSLALLLITLSGCAANDLDRIYREASKEAEEAIELSERTTRIGRGWFADPLRVRAGMAARLIGLLNDRCQERAHSCVIAELKRRDFVCDDAADRTTCILVRWSSYDINPIKASGQRHSWMVWVERIGANAGIRANVAPADP